MKPEDIFEAFADALAARLDERLARASTLEIPISAAQLAEKLETSVDTIDRSAFPCVRLGADGRGERRFYLSRVLAELDARAAAPSGVGNVVRLSRPRRAAK